MIGDYVPQSFLTDPPQTSAIAAASDWVSGLLFGPLATAIAIIAIAAIGLAMLEGRINVRRGIFAVFGCFLLFGARGIAEGLQSASRSSRVEVPDARIPPAPDLPIAVQSRANAGAYDPYAGASVVLNNP